MTPMNEDICTIKDALIHVKDIMNFLLSYLLTLGIAKILEYLLRRLSTLVRFKYSNTHSC